MKITKEIELSMEDVGEIVKDHLQKDEHDKNWIVESCVCRVTNTGPEHQMIEKRSVVVRLAVVSPTRP